MKIQDVISAAFRGKTAPDSKKIAELLADTEAATNAARERLAKVIIAYHS